MSDDRRKLWLPLGVLAAALVVWAAIFALGAYLELGAERPQRDLRKALIVLGTMAAFLAFWGILLLLRVRRTSGKRRSQSPAEESHH